MISFLRTILLFTVAGIVTLVLGTTVIVAALLGVQDKPRGLFEKAPRWWSSAVLWAAGIKVRVHGKIQRENRKAAFGAYDVAAEKIRSGSSVIVFPEGTRGHAYPLRPFKKGPFVLAIAAGVPIVPVIVHGTIEIMPKGSFWVQPGTIDVHLLEPVSTAGVDYEHREALMQAVRTRMADAMRELYGVEPLPIPASRLPSSVEILSSDTQPTETR